MLATILNTPVAVEASIQIVRAFSSMRLVLTMHRDLAQRVRKIESAIRQHDQTFDVVSELLSEIMNDPKYLKRKIGFIENKEKEEMNQELQLGKYEFYPYEFDEDRETPSLEELLERYRKMSEDEKSELSKD